MHTFVGQSKINLEGILFNVCLLYYNTALGGRNNMKSSIEISRNGESFCDYLSASEVKKFLCYSH